MRETLARLNADDAFGFGDERTVAIGIGIHTGLACVGNMGAETRFNYSAVGDAVNVAARIESACKEVDFDILVSESTASLAERLRVTGGRRIGAERQERQDKGVRGGGRRARCDFG